MKLPWVKSKASSRAELEQQLAAARATHEASLAAIDAAEGSFDLEGDASAAKELAKARVDASATAEHVARAERLLQSRERADAEQATRDLEAELEACIRRVAMLKTRADGELVDIEVAAFERVVEARLARLDVHREILRIEASIRRTREELGVAGVPPSRGIRDFAFSNARVAAVLKKLAQGVDQDDPRRRVLHELAEGAA